MLTADKKKLLEVLTKMCPKGKNLESFATHLETYLKQFDITTHKRIAMFLAQAMHECGHFTVFEENLNYSAQGLAATWPSRYAQGGSPNALANKIARKPQEIANYTYADRMGNGGVNSGDGYKFRGRGIFQLTGKSNYAALDKVFADVDCITNPENVALPRWAVASACNFWKANNLNKEADAADVKGATKKINGGDIGLEERTNLYVKLVAM